MSSVGIDYDIDNGIIYVPDYPSDYDDFEYSGLRGLLVTLTHMRHGSNDTEELKAVIDDFAYEYGYHNDEIKRFLPSVLVRQPEYAPEIKHTAIFIPDECSVKIDYVGSED